MSHLIYFYKYPENLSEPECQTLDTIYFTHFSTRKAEDILLKIIIIVVSVVIILRTLFLLFKLCYLKRVSFIFSLLGCVNVFNVVVYISFIFISQNNVFRSISVPGSDNCASQWQLYMEMKRSVWFHASSKAFRWLTAFVCGLPLDYFRKMQFLPHLNTKTTPFPIRIFMISVLVMSTLSELPDVIYEIHNDMECHKWKFLPAQEVITLALEYWGPSLVMIGIAIRMKIENNRHPHKIHSIGRKSIRCPTPNDTHFYEELKTFVMYFIVILLLVIDLSPLRHLLILVGVYDLKNYLTDEKICDFLDIFVLTGNFITVEFCFKLMKRIVIFNTSCLQSGQQISIERHSRQSVTLNDLELCEIKWNVKAEDSRQSLNELAKKSASNRFSTKSSSRGSHSGSPSTQLDF